MIPKLSLEHQIDEDLAEILTFSKISQFNEVYQVIEMNVDRVKIFFQEILFSLKYEGLCLK